MAFFKPSAPPPKTSCKQPPVRPASALGRAVRPGDRSQPALDYSMPRAANIPADRLQTAFGCSQPDRRLCSQRFSPQKYLSPAKSDPHLCPKPPRFSVTRIKLFIAFRSCNSFFSAAKARSFQSIPEDSIATGLLLIVCSSLVIFRDNFALGFLSPFRMKPSIALLMPSSSANSPHSRPKAKRRFSSRLFMTTKFLLFLLHHSN